MLGVNALKSGTSIVTQSFPFLCHRRRQHDSVLVVVVVVVVVVIGGGGGGPSTPSHPSQSEPLVQGTVAAAWPCSLHCAPHVKSEQALQEPQQGKATNAPRTPQVRCQSES